MTTFTLTTPVNVGTLTAPVNVSSLNITGVNFTTKPSLAPIGAGELDVVLTDPVSGWQETISYQDATVLAFLAQAATAPASGATLQDALAAAVFAKLVADGKLPAGTVTTS
jgi:hypothetical protein